MRINGRASLACKTKIADTKSTNENAVVVEPMGNMPVIKDLVTDMDPHWDKVRAVEPWLKSGGPPPEGEHIASNDSMLHLAGVMGCIMCGACVSDCTVLEVDPNFLGPASLAKAYRFVADPRDDPDNNRLQRLNDYGGVWDCTRCLQCVEVCPKGVAPMDRIMALREKAMETGYTSSYGARHAQAFSKHIEHSGRVNELMLPIESKGFFNLRELLRLVPVGIRAQLRGKMPPLIHKKNPGVENVRRIFRKIGGER